MSFDLYAELASQWECPATVRLPAGLASGFVDGCTSWFVKGELESDQRAGRRIKNDARNSYMKGAESAHLALPGELASFLDPQPGVLPRGWLAIEVTFSLQTPWYSKDDRSFHVLDNPVRKEHVFGVPFMSAASWKGLLRWSLEMTTGLIGPAPLKDENQRQQAQAEVLHLFGNEKGASDDFQRGALAFYPTWFGKIGFEVINPHSRKTRAGTQPIYYEVVPRGVKATLKLLYAPLPRQVPEDGIDPQHALGTLLDATDKLLSVYGFSAKRTAGWGLAKVDKWLVRSGKTSHSGSLEGVKARLGDLLGAEETTA
ncbi:MAG: hypothetical protein KatS3mg011_1034 [Acidimicrobiia bacterium]|nr:MAG: hypothetical protein KatS3mg011_1034 [Acidimicrobiia bacterium]